MAQEMSWTEIKKSFPDEWVAIIHEQGDLSSPYGTITGEVIAHHHNESLFTQQLKSLSLHKIPVDIRYTGELIPDNPVGPVLWQISDTNS